MTFTIEDYENAIARIFINKDKHDNKEYVIGTGFLIAPGYVLTCAHVVLQANHVSEDNFTKDEYNKQPETEICLDFPVLASGQKINAKVVLWSSYNLENGDIAVLKLLTPHPKEAKPMPLVEVLCTEVENDKHSVYGFGKSSSGGRSDAYRPKINVAGGRFQLCKYGDPNDETIQPGFSGAPVWNDSRKCVIGMVATATVTNDKEGQQNTAYAISTKQLQNILKQINAIYLHDILTQSLNACGNNMQNGFNVSINNALQRCNPQGGDCSWQQQLVDLIDHPSPSGWEIEGKLVYFVMMLAWMKETPTSALDELKAWVKRCGHEYSNLLDRIHDEMRQKHISPSNTCECIMVAVQEVETSTDELRVSLWAVPNRETYNPHNPPIPLVSQKELSRQKLPKFIRDLIRDKLYLEPTPTIHLFLPRKLFSENFEMLSASPKLKAFLGSEYPFVVRTNLQTHPIGNHYKGEWDKKWKQLEEAFEKRSRDEVKLMDCSLPPKKLISKIKGIYAARLKECNSVDELFDLIAEATVLPVALWSRDTQFQKQLTRVLECSIKDLPERILQERNKAYNSDKELLGHNLSLVWEDPKIVPPDMQFEPEMC